ncbi:MAG TPA: YajQ family cyclic di-GMP-binding protein [Edaphocola sp.]|nr:YajQ family cyclic di-GMP-binding protein [Edaphocola sp.]
MATFDITNKVDLQTLDNAMNIALKEINTRYDFKGIHCEINLDKKNYVIKIEIESEMQLRQAEDIIVTKAMRQGLDAKSFDLSKEATAAGKYLRKEIKVRNGIEQSDAKKIVKAIKDSGLKVQAAIMDDIIRVTGKKIDDLQAVIALCNTSNFDLPLQYVNMKD